MAGSAADAISPAVERCKQLLFPFRAEKWFALGFTVFMARCSEGGGGGSFNVPSLPSGTSTHGSGRGSGSVGVPNPFQDMLDTVTRTVTSDPAFYIGMAVGFVLAIFGIWAFVLWFSSRAKLMFVESVIWDRVDVGTQWTRAAELGRSLFKFRALVGMGGSLLVMSTVAAGVFVAWPDFHAKELLGSRAVVGYSLMGFGFLFFGLPTSIVLALLDDFVVPLMVVRNVRVGEAWGLARAEVFAGHVGGIFLFYILRVVLTMGIGIATMFVTCFTCCMTAIPYLGTVILLPFSTFQRAYSLCYLEELGVRVFPVPEPSWAQYEQWRFPT